MAEVKSLKDLFIDNLCRAADAEQRLVKALPTLRDAATSEELRHALQTHFEESQVHADRVDQIFGFFGEQPRTQTCKSIKDAALIAAVQEAEHFEIALYGTLRAWATVLGKTEAMETLEVTLEEEKAIDALLTSIAATLNLQAAHAG
jgi:ferritin-like metal-binding protein YciE